jgi:hypothetical protein
LNGRNFSALYEIVDGRERNPQVLSRLFYGKQIVNWSFAQNLSENAQASLRTMRCIIAILIQASLVRGLIS